MSDRTTTLELEAFFPYRVAVLAAEVSRGLAAVYRERFGVQPAEWRILAHLAQSAGGSVREIHEHANLDKAKVSRAVERLVGRGLVEKSPNPADRRLVRVVLTRAGRSLYRRIVPHARAFERDLLSSLSRSDRAALDRIIEKLETAARSESHHVR